MNLPLPDGVNHVVTFAEYARVGGELDAARAERDRLAAENARLEALVVAKNESIEVLYAKWSKEIVKRDAANATLDKLREKVPECTRWCSDCEKMTLPDADDPDFCAECEGEDVWTRGVLVDIHAILYTKETTDAG